MFFLYKTRSFKILTIFKEVFFVIEVSVILHEEEADLLLKHMKDNNIKSKAKIVIKCIDFASKKLSIDDMICDIDNKINRLLYIQNFKKKLLEPFYANMEF